MERTCLISQWIITLVLTTRSSHLRWVWRPLTCLNVLLFSDRCCPNLSQHLRLDWLLNQAISHARPLPWCYRWHFVCPPVCCWGWPLTRRCAPCGCTHSSLRPLPAMCAWSGSRAYSWRLCAWLPWIQPDDRHRWKRWRPNWNGGWYEQRLWKKDR